MVVSKGRRKMTTAEKSAHSERMRVYWAKRKATEAGASTASGTANTMLTIALPATFRFEIVGGIGQLSVPRDLARTFVSEVVNKL